VLLPTTNLPPDPHLRLGQAAVLEASDGRLGHWALRHVGEQPDFHGAAGFVLELERSGLSA